MNPHGQHSCIAPSLCLCLEMAHFASSGDGLVVTLDKESGEVLWAQNYGSPVVGIYVWHQDSLRRVPHLNLAMETLRYLTFHSQDIPLLRWSYQAVRDFAATKTQLLYVAPVLRQPVAAALFVLGRSEPWLRVGRLMRVPALQASSLRGEARSWLLRLDLPGPWQRGSGGECPRCPCACCAAAGACPVCTVLQELPDPSHRASRWPGSTAPPRMM